MIGHQEFLAGLDWSELECRDVRHAWVPSNSVFRTRDGGTIRILSCERCSTTKYQLIKGGRVISVSMKYPVGYVKGKDVEAGRIDRSEILEESLSRTQVAKHVPSDVVAFLDRRGLSLVN